MDAVVLGGGKPFDGSTIKPLIQINNQPMAFYTLKALKEAGIEKISYVGPTNDDLMPLIDEISSDQGSMLANLVVGLQKLPTNKRIMIATADIPLIKAQSITELIKKDPGAGVVYPIISIEIMNKSYPNGRRTYVKLCEGQFTGGNIFIIDGEKTESLLKNLKNVIEHRKNPLALAKLFGFFTLTKFLLGRLSLTELEKRVSRVLEMPAKALPIEHPEIAFDVDQPEDLALIKQLLQ